MHDWGDMLVHAGFAEPVMDMERIVLTWATPEAALAELRTLGATCTRRAFRRCAARHGDQRAAAGAARAGAGRGRRRRIALTFEIIYGHAFKPAPRVALSAESAVSLREMRSMLQASARP